MFLFFTRKSHMKHKWMLGIFCGCQCPSSEKRNLYFLQKFPKFQTLAQKQTKHEFVVDNTNKYEHILKLTTVSTHPSPVICSCRLCENYCAYMWGQPCVPTAPCTPRGLINMTGLWLIVTWRTQPWNGGRFACRPGTGIPTGGEKQ